MSDQQPAVPDHTAVRTALWRALHVAVDAPPHVLDDTVGLRLVDPPADWRDRPDMNPVFSAAMRAAIVARARVVDDLVADAVGRGVGQFVVLGAGLDSLAERRTDLMAAGLRVFEVDQPATQAWKQRRLVETGIGVPDGLRFVPVDFESDEAWWDALVAAGFDPARPAVVASTGVTMYLTRDAIDALLREVAQLAPGSALAITFLRPAELLSGDDRRGFEIAERGARAAGTPWLSLFAPDDFVAVVRAAGFADVEYVSADDTTARWFADRPDGLRPSNGEEMVIARV
ncbi:MAG: class I SAM-dependent methyltransferase [Acidimicrobiales bacterium]